MSMMIFAALLAALACPVGSNLTPSPEFSMVFAEGDGGFANIRIPSVVVTNRGVVLAFAEGRDGRQSDQARNKIIERRSMDGGKTWGELQVIAGDGDNSLNNPCAVVDRSTGRVILMYQRIPAHLSEGSKEIAVGYEGPNVYRSFVVTSDDDGRTWSTPADITRSVKRPVHANTIAVGPGIGIQLTRGAHRGRLVMPFNEGPFYQWNNYAVFSDDHGKSWRYGENVPGALVPFSGASMRSQINEVQVAERSDGSLLLSSRRFAGAKVRKSSISTDGGETWSPVQDVPEIQDPSCMASLFRYSFGRGRDRGILLYSGPDSDKRERGTIYVSRDDGQSWPMKRVLVPGDFAYSVLTRLKDGTVGCLFETDDYRAIKFARISLNWILDKAASE